MDVLADDWKTSDPPKNVLTYVSDFRRRIFEVGQIAKARLGKAQDRMKRFFDRRTEVRSFQQGDQVLALLPIVGSPFQAKFVGPYTVARQISDLNYLIETPDRNKKTRVCHINLLKPYYACREVNKIITGTDMKERKGSDIKPVLLTQTVGPDVTPSEDEFYPGDSALQGRLQNSEALATLVDRLNYLVDEQRTDLINLITEYVSLFSDIPSCTHLIEHDIDVGDSIPIRQRYYRVSANKKKHMDAEIDYMLKNGIAEPPFSSWASPSLLVSKSDGSFRFCTDYRKVCNQPDLAGIYLYKLNATDGNSNDHFYKQFYL